MTVSTIGLDIAKRSFHVHAVDEQGQCLISRALKRHQVRQWLATLDRTEDCVVGLEACGTCHYWARELRKLGYEPRIMKTTFVKPYLRGQKNDANDARAICEAVQRPDMRFVPEKDEQQQSIIGVHHIRDRQIAERTRLINQTRALLLEMGMAIPVGRRAFAEALPRILEESDNDLPWLLRDTLAEVYDEYRALEARIDRLTGRLEALSRSDTTCQRLEAIEGVGALTATLLMAIMGNTQAFRSGRDFAAYLGLTPRQHSTGGESRLLGISKAGNGMLRRFLVHGARAAVQRTPNKDDARSRWVQSLSERRHRNVVTVALAAKNARTALAIVKRGTEYAPA